MNTVPRTFRPHASRLMFDCLEDRFTPAANTITLSNNTATEFRPGGTLVGTMTAIEADAPIPASYDLVSGTGDDNNADFAIDGNRLVTAAALNSSHAPYAIRVRATTADDGVIVNTFTVTATDDPNVSLAGRTLTVDGTTGNDSFAFASDAVEHQMALNGVNLAVEVADADTVVFDGHGGNDSADLTGSGKADTNLSPIATLVAPSGGAGGYGSLTGDTYTVYADAPRVTAHSRDSDHGVAFLQGSDGNDTLTATGGYVSMTGKGYYNGAVGFHASASYDVGPADGDVAYMTGDDGAGHGTSAVFEPDDSTGSQDPPRTYAATSANTPPPYAYTGRVNIAYGFRNVNFSTAPGLVGDLSLTPFIDTEPAVFVGTPEYSLLSGAGYRVGAVGFRQVVAAVQPLRDADYRDSAYILGTAGNDTLNTDVIGYELRDSTGYRMTVRGFKTITVDATQGGTDAANVDSLPFLETGDAEFDITPTYATFTAPGLVLATTGFSQFLGGRSSLSQLNDRTLTVNLADTPADDTLTADKGNLQLAGSIYSVRLSGLGGITHIDKVSSYATAGGTNRKHVGTTWFTLNTPGNWVDDPSLPLPTA